MIDVPAMGYDGTDYTIGYIKDGQVPQFMVYKSSVDSFIEISAETIPEWKNNLLATLSGVSEKITLPHNYSNHLVVV